MECPSLGLDRGMCFRMLAAPPCLAATLLRSNHEASGGWTIDASGHRVDRRALVTESPPPAASAADAQQSVNGRMFPSNQRRPRDSQDSQPKLWSG